MNANKLLGNSADLPCLLFCFLMTYLY